jgi:4'-phosphopantetheinyl transferase
MPLAFTDIWQEHDVRILLWEINESPDFFRQRLTLPELEARYVDSIKTERRRLQSFATRWLLQEQLGAVELAKLRRDEFGRPFLHDSDWHVGFSHTGFLSGLAVAPAKVGLDVQKFDERIPKFARLRFASPAELVLMTETDSFDYLHVMWGLKEAMYKACGLRGVHFTENMIAEPFVFQKQGGYIHAIIDMPGHEIQKYQATYFKWHDHMVVVAVAFSA